MTRNTGLDLERQQLELRPQTDWRFGAASKQCLFMIPNDRREYLPDGELQFGLEDFLDCATRSPINYMEAKFTYAYRNGLLLPENRVFLQENGYVVYRHGLACIEFADRFNAVLSGTTRAGNSLVSPIASIHRDGMIPKDLLPRDATMTWAQYHDRSKITDRMIQLGREFAARFTINYELVYRGQFKAALANDFLCVAGYAWPTPENGEYPDPGDVPPNHAFLAFSLPAYLIFDNYFDTDGDYIKKLSGDFSLYEVAYRIFVSSQQVADPIQNAWLQNDIVRRFLALLQSIGVPFGAAKSSLDAFLNDFWDVLYRAWYGDVGDPYSPEPVVEDTAQVPPERRLTAIERLCNEAKEWIGKDASPANRAQSERACAETVTHLVGLIDPTIEWTNNLSTAAIQADMIAGRHFVEVEKPRPGTIVISATRGRNIGHTGIFLTETRIGSNGSHDGIFRDNYSKDSWIMYFLVGKGLEVRYFDMVDLIHPTS